MKTYMKNKKHQVVEADPIDVYADDSEERKKQYLDKIRKMGILRQESEMPKRAAVGQIEESIKKSGRHGFEPVSSEYAAKLLRREQEKAGTSFKYDPKNPTEMPSEKLKKIERAEEYNLLMKELKKIKKEQKERTA